MSGYREQAGKVWIAGAGPGDRELLTVKTARLIKEADVIVYDALISAEILTQIPEQKELIHVGKRSGNHTVLQEEISRILVQEAKKGKKVLRLKGGDPFVFGRGGEEVELLVKEQIPFEVVPGVTSCTAVPAYAGIPVTHRDCASSFHVITGHAQRDGEIRIDFPSLARLGGTLVFLMGLARLGWIAKGLLDAGMKKDTPAAVVENGTTAKQRKVISVLSDIEEKAKAADIQTPAIIIVGEVCAFSESFDWTVKRKLGGRQFLTTRPRQNSSRLAKRLRDLGAQVIEMPSIRTEEILPNPRLEDALARLGKRSGEQWLVFTSPIGVSVFFDGLRRRKTDIRKLLGGSAVIKVAAIGSATAAALEEAGIFADLVPEKYNAEELGRILAETAAKNSHITILRAEAGSPMLLPPLYKAGIWVEDVALYRTCTEGESRWKEKLTEMLKRGEIDAVAFTSASTVRGFAQMMEGVPLSQIHALCIGEQTEKEAANYHMQTEVALEASMDGMEKLILQKYGIR